MAASMNAIPRDANSSQHELMTRVPSQESPTVSVVLGLECRPFNIWIQCFSAHYQYLVPNMESLPVLSLIFPDALQQNSVTARTKCGQ